MAATPRFKVFEADGSYQASCKRIEDAAMLVAAYGDGGTIRDRTQIVWREGREAVSAAESYDEVARIVWERIDRNVAERLARVR